MLHPADSSYMVLVLLMDEDGLPLLLAVAALHERIRLTFCNHLCSNSPFVQPLAEWDDVSWTCAALSFIVKCFVMALHDNMGMFRISHCAVVLDVQPLVCASADMFQKAALPAHGLPASVAVQAAMDPLIKEVSGLGNGSSAVAEVLLLCDGLYAACRRSLPAAGGTMDEPGVPAGA